MQQKPNKTSREDTVTYKSWAKLRPVEELAALKQRFGPSIGYGEPSPPTLEVTGPLVEVLRLGLNELVDQRNRAVEDAGRQGARAVRSELCTRVYVRFVENLSDDTIEDLSIEDIGAAARDLLAEMY